MIEGTTSLKYGGVAPVMILVKFRPEGKRVGIYDLQFKRVASLSLLEFTALSAHRRLTLACSDHQNLEVYFLWLIETEQSDAILEVAVMPRQGASVVPGGPDKWNS